MNSMHRKKFILTILSFNIILSVVLGQKIELEPLTVEAQRIFFVTQDSTYEITRLINQNGRFSFQRGFIDTSDLKSYFLFKEEKIKGKKVGKNYKVEYHFIEGIDTIQCFYMDNMNDPAYPDTLIINTPITTYYINDILIEDIKFSYIFNTLKNEVTFNSTDSSIYCLFPHDRFKYQYLLLKLDYLENNKYNFFLYSIASNDLSGLQIVRNDSSFVKNKKLQNIRKKINQIKELPNTNCLLLDNPWLLAFSNKRFIISFYCMQRSEDKSLHQISDLYWTMQQLKYKYFRK